MEKAFHAKAQEVLSGKTTMLSTSTRVRRYLDGERPIGEATLLRTLQNTGIGAFGGFFFGACEMAWYPDYATDYRGNRIDTPIRAVLARVLHPAVFLGIGMGSFTFAQLNFEILRDVQDPWNAGYAGGLTGFLAGFIYLKRIDLAIWKGIQLGVGLGLSDLVAYWVAWKPDIKEPPLRPKAYKESDELRELKELYPKFKDM